MSGIAGGADVILIPEQPVTVEQACRDLQRRHERGKDFSIVVVSEGYELTYESGERQTVTQDTSTDAFGHVRLGGVGDELAREIQERTGYETRVTVLGHVQRGGTPEPGDRVIASAFGVHAVDLIAEKRFDRMVAWNNRRVIDVPIEDAIRAAQTVDPQGELVTAARGLGISFGDSVK
jgi:6-phosphofructokinase 1